SSGSRGRAWRLFRAACRPGPAQARSRSARSCGSPEAAGGADVISEIPLLELLDLEVALTGLPPNRLRASTSPRHRGSFCLHRSSQCSFVTGELDDTTREGNCIAIA